MTVPVSPGDVIDGSYVIERLLGQGGMGAVFVAREERLNRRVAIKVLLDAVASNPEAVARFEREARSAAALQSDHVTRVLSVGRLKNNAPYIVMELMEGEDLSQILATRGPLPVKDVIAYMTDACEALSEAHALGIVHRDLKPANVFLAKRPGGGTRVKVLDFGISKSATTSSTSALTKTTALMGTPLYMSPEQLREARNVDGRADVWALGIMMYELLTGKPPFNSEALAELCVFIMTTRHPSLIGARPDVPPALDAIVSRCLEKEPSARFASAAELTAALSSVPLTPGHAAPVPPRMATPQMSPRVDTEAVAARQRAQAPTEAQGQAPQTPMPSHLPSPPPGTGPMGSPYGPPPAPGHSPRLLSQPTTLDRQAASQMGMPAMAGTVDPVSNTQTWMPPKRPSFLGLGLVVIVVALIGGAALYTIFLRGSGDGPGSAAAASGAPSVSASAPSSAAASVSTSTSPSSSVASGSSTPSFAPSGANGLRLTPLAAPNVGAPNGGVANPGTRPQGGTLPPALPVALPPPGGQPAAPVQPPSPPVVVTAPASAHPPPSSKPPPLNPGSLMPGARN